MLLTAQESLQPLVDFYLGFCTDQSGRVLEEVLEFGDAELEASHDYIQWLFPLRERSRAVAGSPVIDENQVGVFRHNLMLQVRLQDALDVMLQFYGLARLQDHPGSLSIVRRPNFSARCAVWLTPGNHNFLRITRILKSLRLLGLESQAEAFFRSLETIYHENAETIGKTTFCFWTDAVRN